MTAFEKVLSNDTYFRLMVAGFVAFVAFAAYIS